MMKDEKLKLIWKTTHKDFKGKIGLDKYILVYRNGTCMVKLTDLTDEEINDRLPKDIRDQV